MIVKRACRLAGLDPDRYAGNSLRSGLATSAAEGGRARALDHEAARPPQLAHEGHRQERAEGFESSSWGSVEAGSLISGKEQF